MYSSIETVNILTALLLEHGVRHAVVSPGSRNAPICHNIKETGKIKCYPVTDERSAGFFAIGVSQATGLSPVVVCVTSGSAILDVAPAVAEAYYQQIPIIVIAADRPAAWIGQLDGQTMPQPDAFGKMVRRSVSLPAGNTDEEIWYANRLINEALMDAAGPICGPVLINVPLSEPLYEFRTPELPEVRVCKRIESDGRDVAKSVASRLNKARRPMVIFGQTLDYASAQAFEDRHSKQFPILGEALSGVCVLLDPTVHVLRNARNVDIDDFRPDLIIYAGGTLVSKETKQFLRSCTDAETILISPDGELHDVFQNTTLVARCTLKAFVEETADIEGINVETDYQEGWDALLCKIDCLLSPHPGEPRIDDYLPQNFSQLAVFRAFTDFLSNSQIANSSAIRIADALLWNVALRSVNTLSGVSKREFGIVYCNRGINGIDGCLSTAAGFSAADKTGEPKLCVIGDLSFFYDQNALWNTNIDGRLRILLINNGGGGIFNRFKGLKGSMAKDDIVMAKHHATARGICEENDVEYRSASDFDELSSGRYWLTQELANTKRPRLLEVFTDMDEDAAALNNYYDNLVTYYDRYNDKY